MVLIRTTINKRGFIPIKMLCLGVLILTLHSCVKDKLTDPEPEDPVLNLTLDWSNGDPDAVIPSTFTVRIDNQSASLSGNPVSFPQPLETGTYPMLVYTNHDAITVNGNVATVNAVPVSRSELVIASDPGWLFSAAMDVTLTEGENTATAVMRQLIRVLNLSIEVDNPDAGIQSVTAGLSGVVHSINLETGEIIEGTASSAASFVLSGNTLVARFQLLGLQPLEDNLLTVTVTYADDSRQTFVSDLTDKLTDFNEGGETPVDLEANIQITQTPVGFSGTISDWKTANHSGSAH